MQKAKDWNRTAKEITGTEEILEADFGSRNYISTEEKPLASNFGEAKHKDKNLIYFNILDGLL